MDEVAHQGRAGRAAGRWGADRLVSFFHSLELYISDGIQQDSHQ